MFSFFCLMFFSVNKVFVFLLKIKLCFLFCFNEIKVSVVGVFLFMISIEVLMCIVFNVCFRKYLNGFLFIFLLKVVCLFSLVMVVDIFVGVLLVFFKKWCFFIKLILILV